jgi:hypothetical protein
MFENRQLRRILGGRQWQVIGTGKVVPMFN